MQKPRPITTEHLGQRKQQLLNRLSRSGAILVNDVVEDEFSQMSVSECRSFVQNVEQFLRSFIQQVT